jgi:hypothetical protein
VVSGQAEVWHGVAPQKTERLLRRDNKMVDVSQPTAHLTFSRPHVQLVNQNKVFAVYDFIFGDYLAQKNFFDELSRVQSGLLNDGTVTLNTGHKVNMENLGDMVALQLYIETIETTRESMSGLSKLGMKTENKLWSML